MCIGGQHHVRELIAATGFSGLGSHEVGRGGGMRWSLCSPRQSLRGNENGFAIIGLSCVRMASPEELKGAKTLSVLCSSTESYEKLLLEQ